MTTLVGLGNPGLEYAQTKHNVGFVVVDQLVSQLGLSWTTKPKFQAEIAKDQRLTLVKPLSFMNRSGQPVRAVLDFFGEPIEVSGEATSYNHLYVVHDDLDLELGSFKIQFGKGPHGHNGLLSLYQHLGTKAFWHVRVGVDGREGSRIVPSDAYVLTPFSSVEQPKIKQVIEEVCQVVLKVVNAPL